MKSNFLLMLLLALSFNVFSQKISGELNYPLPIGDNYLAKNFNGIIDIGGKFRIIKLPKTGFGIGLNGSLMSNKDNAFYNTKTYVIQPKAYGYLNILKFQPFLGIGYSFLHSSSKINNISEFDPITNPKEKINNTDTAFNLNLGIKYKFLKKFFFQVQYDYLKVFVDNSVPDISYNTNVNIIKFGVGAGI